MAKYIIAQTRVFKKDLKTIIRRGYNVRLLDTVVTLLSEGKTLPSKYKDHPLSGKFRGCRECHITPDWLLIYEADKETLYLYLTRTGTHSDLF